MREPTRRAKIFAAAAQRARLTRRLAAPVSQRSEERWVLVDAQPPQGDVELVGAIVADVAGAEVVPPVPIVVEPILLKGQPFGGTDPHVVVDVGRRI